MGSGVPEMGVGFAILNGGGQKKTFILFYFLREKNVFHKALISLDKRCCDFFFLKKAQTRLP